MADNPERHGRDAMSLVLGLVLLAVAGLFLLVDLTDRSPDLRWVGPVLLIGIGIAGLAAAVRRREPR